MSLDQGRIISFRVRADDMKEFKRIADVLYILGKLKKPSVGLMCRKFLYVMTNQSKVLETLAPQIVQQQQVA